MRAMRKPVVSPDAFPEATGPLDVLEVQVDGWIAAEAAKPKG